MKVLHTTAVAALLLLAPASASASSTGVNTLGISNQAQHIIGDYRPNPASSPTPPLEIQDSLHCPLTRIGTQFVRCDNLTGAGVNAPAWVPELYPGN